MPGNYEGAVEGFELAREIRPLNHVYHTCLGKVYLNWPGHEHEALHPLSRSLEITTTAVASRLKAKALKAVDRGKSESTITLKDARTMGSGVPAVWEDTIQHRGHADSRRTDKASDINSGASDAYGSGTSDARTSALSSRRSETQSSDVFVSTAGISQNERGLSPNESECSERSGVGSSEESTAVSLRSGANSGDSSGVPAFSGGIIPHGQHSSQSVSKTGESDGDYDESTSVASSSTEETVTSSIEEETSCPPSISPLVSAPAYRRPTVKAASRRRSDVKVEDANGRITCDYARADGSLDQQLEPEAVTVKIPAKNVSREKASTTGTDTGAPTEPAHRPGFVSRLAAMVEMPAWQQLNPSGVGTAPENAAPLGSE